jgi:hypothetical protein
MSITKLDHKEKQSTKVIPIINTLIDKLEDLEVMMTMQDEIIGHQQDKLGDLKTVLADFMEWTGYLKHLDLKRNNR